MKLSMLAVAMLIGAGTASAAPPQAKSGQVAMAQGDRTSKAAEALSRGETLEALTRADEAVRADPASGWAHYNRAAALAALERIDEAVAAYDEAAAKFGKNERGKSLAMWGKAHALYRVGRCGEARQAFGEFSKMAGNGDPEGAALASERASTCRPVEGAAKTSVAASGAAAKDPVATTPAKPSADDKSAMPSLVRP